MTTDQQLAEAVAGGLQGFTLYPTPDGRWQASTTRDKIGWQVFIADDPIDAVRLALSGLSTKKTDNAIPEGIFG